MIPPANEAARRVTPKVDDQALALVWVEAWKLIPIPSPNICNQGRAWKLYYERAALTAEKSVSAFRALIPGANK